jgi:hypothetical protein
MTMMKCLVSFFLGLLLGTAARAQSSSNHHHLRSLATEEISPHERSLIALDGSVTACIEVKDGQTNNGNSFILGDCAKHKYGIDEVNAVDLCSGEDCREKLDDDDSTVLMYQTRLKSNKCMQATHGGKNAKLKAGAWLRVYPCDPLNSLQHFVRVMGDEIQVKGTDLCVSYLGVNPHVNEDQIMLKKCSEIGEDGWSYD